MSDQFPEKPKGIQIKHFNDHAIIIMKWFSVLTWFYTGFTLFWSLIIFPISFGLLNSFGMAIGTFLLVAPFLIVSILLFYITISMWINRTYIIANNQAIIVRHQPLPKPEKLNPFSWGNHKFSVVNLENLYSKKTVERAKFNADESHEYFEVRIKRDNDLDRNLIKVGSHEVALFIEKTLRDYFKIEDEPQERC